MIMLFLKTIVEIISNFLLIWGLFLIIWPLLYFGIIPVNWRESIINWIYNLPKDDPSAGAALPFVWFFWHVPWGIFYMIVGCLFKFLKGHL